MLAIDEGVHFLHMGQRTIWSGQYLTWLDALAAAAAINRASLEITGFNSQRWIVRQRGMLQAARDGRAPRHSSLPILAAGMAPRTIVDFGGGSGWAYELLAGNTKRVLRGYVVIEQEVTTNVFSNEFQGDRKVEFISTARQLDATSESVNDLLYSNSALQYLPDNSTFLNILDRFQPKMILIDDFQTSADTEFFSLQHYYGEEIPCRFSQVDDLQRDFLEFGYTLQGAWSFPKTFGGALEPRVESTTDTPLTGEPQTLLFERDLATS